MTFGDDQFGTKVLGYQIEGTPIFPPVAFGEESCVSISDNTENLSIASECTDEL